MSVRPSLDPRFVIENPDEVLTPALAVYPELIRENLAATLKLAGDPARVRPHVKTHKTIELTKIELAAGVVKHKCATFAEAEVLADAGAKDIVFAYPLVGPNIARFVRLKERYPSVRIRPLVDHPDPARRLGEAMKNAGQVAEPLIDLDVGMGRTGIPIGADAVALYRLLDQTPGLGAGGIHLYEGHNHQRIAAERDAATDAVWEKVRGFIASLKAEGLTVPRIVAGNSGTFPRWAKLAEQDPRIEGSPGTFFLNDWNYYSWFPDIPMLPAAVLLSRVISKPVAGRLTLDLGYKAVSPDSPPAERVALLNIPDATFVRQNEEHLVVDTPAADRFAPGDLVYAWPAHVCPSVALHRELLVIENHRPTGAWPVAARDRFLHC